jgi:hypothetical protein
MQAGSAAVAKYFLYADESGDPGHNTQVTTHYVLAGFLLNEDQWNPFWGKIKAFRDQLGRNYGLRVRAEVRAQDIWNAKGGFENLGLSYAKRYRVFRDIVFFLGHSPEISIIVVSIEKSQPKLSNVNIKQYAWKLLIQRFENFLVRERQHGLIFSDPGGEGLIRGQLRKMRQYNPIPSLLTEGFYQGRVVQILEDPIFRDSRHSYFVQWCDVIAYLCRLRDNQSKKQRRWKLHKMYKLLSDRYLKAASKKDSYGFVYG